VKIIASILLITLTFMSGCGSNDSGGLPTCEMQALIDRAVSGSGIPGAIVAVETMEGQWIGVSGLSDFTEEEPMRPDMGIRLASVTKTFTSVLIMKLVEDGMIGLDDPVETWLPGILPDGNNITIHMLLNHTSGLFDHERSSEFWDRLLSEPTSVWETEDVLDIVNSHDAEFAPGEAWSYCNSGYYILGMIVEAVTNSTVEEEMETNFFTPLGMTRTSLSRNGAMGFPYAHGYSWIPTTEEIVDTSDWDLSWDWTAGAGVTTAEDILTWTHALFNEQILSDETLQIMLTPIPPSTHYGYGIIISDSPRAFSHDGSNPGTATQWLYLPDSKITIFIALNRLDTWLDDDEPVEEVIDSEEVRDQILIGLMDILGVAF